MIVDFTYVNKSLRESLSGRGEFESLIADMQQLGARIELLLASMRCLRQ